VWYASKDIEGGRTVLEQVKSAIQSHDRAILILSGNSLRTGWVSNELRLAYNRERECQRRILFPILIVSSINCSNGNSMTQTRVSTCLVMVSSALGGELGALCSAAKDFVS
jgi:hypothetical protein